jgi:hypothetical protein
MADTDEELIDPEDNGGDTVVVNTSISSLTHEASESLVYVRSQSDTSNPPSNQNSNAHIEDIPRPVEEQTNTSNVTRTPRQQRRWERAQQRGKLEAELTTILRDRKSVQWGACWFVGSEEM